MKKIIFYFSLVVFIFIVFYGLYFLNSPRFTLFQLMRSYKQHDIHLAKKYMDIDLISDQAADVVEEMVNEEMNKPSEATNEWEKMGEDFGKTLLLSYIPKLREETKKNMEKAFVDSIENNEMNGDDKLETPLFRRLSVVDILLPTNLIKISKEGVLRYVIIPGTNQDIKYRLRKEDGAWRIVGVENFRDILKSFSENEDKDIENNESMKKADYGERVDIYGGWFLTVYAPEEYMPTSYYDRADKGNKLIAIDVMYENESRDDGGFDSDNFELKDTENYRYSQEYSGKSPELDSGTLHVGEKVRGYITYEVPQEASPSGVLYSSVKGGTVLFE